MSKSFFYRWSSWLLVGFLIFYIYVVALYFLYSSQSTVDNYRGASRYEDQDALIHDHHAFNPNDINDIHRLMKFRSERFIKAQNRPENLEGPGEGGNPVSLSKDEQELADRLFAKETFNVIASNKIAMDRSLRDARPDACKSVNYPEKLPNASVVIVFCNEAPSALLRTVHSVINRSPPQYLHEVILVDDASERPEVGEELDNYVEKVWPDKMVKIVRSKKRLGLIRGRMRGAEAASGDVLIFLDAHCEATYMWIEPILARIGEDRTIVICPMIDSISDKTLQYHYGGGVAVGGFSWALHFTWRSVPAREQAKRKSEADPARSPTMAGGLFAADRKYFFELGGYDPGMDVWGGENLEISFRTWMCGGSMEFLPCSRVGHIFRAAHPYSFLKKDTHGMNSKRLAEVWMDDYKRLYYKHRPDLVDKDAGAMTERKTLREKLKCHDFKWFLENVYPEKFIPDENVRGYGMVSNPSTHMCLDILGKDEKSSFELGVFSCQGGKSSSEVFSHTITNELRREDLCVDAPSQPGAVVHMRFCHGYRGNQEWIYDTNTKQFFHSSRSVCLDVEGIKNGEFLKVKTCNDKSETQKWEFEKIFDLPVPHS